MFPIITHFTSGSTPFTVTASAHMFTTKGRRYLTSYRTFSMMMMMIQTPSSLIGFLKNPVNMVLNLVWISLFPSFDAWI